MLRGLLAAAITTVLTIGCLFVVIVLYTVAPVFSEVGAVAATVLVSIGWAAWVVYLSRSIVRAVSAASPWLFGIAGLLAPASTLVLIAFVSLINVCHAGISFPLPGGSC